MNINGSSNGAFHMTDGGENGNTISPVWSEDEIEELQDETPWEIFSSEIDNWAALNLYSTVQ